MNDAEQAALWRRHFDVLDQLLYGFLEGEARKTLSEEERAESRGDEKAVVTLDELRDRRHHLATVLYYGADSPKGFEPSDPASPRFVGSDAARALRERREIRGEL